MRVMPLLLCVGFACGGCGREGATKSAEVPPLRKSDAAVIGIDVSRYQGDIHWKQVEASGIDFAFIRVSDGLNYVDSRFRDNWRQARKAHVIRGAYQYFRSEEDPLAQAELFLRQVGSLRAGDLPAVLDVESNRAGLNPEEFAASLSVWLERVRQETGRPPIIYTRKNFWERHLGETGLARRHPLWVAHYEVFLPAIPGEWSDWTFHQYTDRGNRAGKRRVHGIRGDVDLNRFNGSRRQLRLLALGL
jgi:lysozyme